MDRFIVEADKRVVGIAISVPGGFQFVCSDPDFRSMDRKVFRRARTLAGDVTQLVRAQRAVSTPTKPH